MCFLRLSRMIVRLATGENENSYCFTLSVLFMTFIEQVFLTLLLTLEAVIGSVVTD